ncbi:MAG: T9SS type A sorting domain-containing protein [Saprospiraceae bacterium]
MKFIHILAFLFVCSNGFSQSLPIDFETNITTSNFVDFDGGEGTVIANPQSNGINTSTMVAQIVRDGGATWAGSKIILSENIDFSTNSILSMKVFTTTPIGTTIKFKLEGGSITERDVVTTTNNEWETLTWDFTGTPADNNQLVFMFDFGNTGNGSATSTFLFDDVEQLYGGEQIDLPVSFEGSTINYTLIPFEGNSAAVVEDPTNSNNTVGMSLKMPGSSPSAGTTVGTAAGFATNIPLTLTDAIMTVKVWSPDAGTPIRLKVENANDPTQTCETEVNTTIGGDWEILEFDFTNEAPGTAALDFGLNNGWIYNKASIFFNFGTAGAATGEKTYYFDNIAFGDFVLSNNNLFLDKVKVFPNPTNDFWNISSEGAMIQKIEIFNLQGQLILTIQPNSNFGKINTAGYSTGMYLSKVTTKNGSKTFKLIKN